MLTMQVSGTSTAELASIAVGLRSRLKRVNLSQKSFQSFRDVSFRQRPFSFSLCGLLNLPGRVVRMSIEV
jgi:hypothetical protein